MSLLLPEAAANVHIGRAREDSGSPRDSRFQARNALFSPTASVITATALTLIFAFADFIVPGEINVAILYGLSVGACAWSLSPKFLWGVTGACVLLTYAGQAFGPLPITGDAVLRLLWINRGLVAAGLVLLAAFVHQWMWRSQRLAEARALLRRQNEALQESDSWLRATFEQAAVGMAHTDSVGRMLRVNERICELTGYTQHELLERSYVDLTHPDDRRSEAAQTQQLLAGALCTLSVEKRFLCKDGTARWVNVARSLVRNASGAPVYCISVVQDIEERKRIEADLRELQMSLETRIAERTRELVESNDRLRQAEECLHQSQKMEALGQLTGGVAHDFNNLLTAVIGNIDMAQARASDERQRLLLAGAQHAAESAVGLTQRLLAFARKQNLRPMPVDLRRLVGIMKDMLDRSLGAAVELSIEAEEELWSALIDAQQIELAILNLALNARDAMPHGGRLTIALANERFAAGSPEDLGVGDYVVVRVSDTGVGMDETTLTRAVEPFFTTKGVGKGTGLGLSTVHGIAVQSGGAMRIRSRSGHGTTVELWLPRSAEQPLQEATGPRQALARGDATVLVCEDYETVREFTREALQDAGFKVVVTENGPAALAALDDEHGSVDLLVVDFAMPGMNGVEVTRRARQCRPELPILLITGNANLGAVSDEAKGIPLLTKPFKQMQIVSAVAGLLESAAAG